MTAQSQTQRMRPLGAAAAMLIAVLAAGCCTLPGGAGCLDGQCPPAGGCTSCGPSYGQGRFTDLVFPLLSNQLTCGSGCGPLYWNEWLSDPPDCCDPCDNHGVWTGPRAAPVGGVLYAGWDAIWDSCLGIRPLYHMLLCPGCASPPGCGYAETWVEDPPFCPDCLAGGGPASMAPGTMGSSPSLAASHPAATESFADPDVVVTEQPLGSGVVVHRMPHAVSPSGPAAAHTHSLHTPGARTASNALPVGHQHGPQGLGAIFGRVTSAGSDLLGDLARPRTPQQPPSHAAAHSVHAAGPHAVAAQHAAALHAKHGRPPHPAAAKHLDAGAVY